MERKIRWYGSVLDAPLTEHTHFFCAACDKVLPIEEFSSTRGLIGLQFCRRHAQVRPTTTEAPI